MRSARSLKLCDRRPTGFMIMHSCPWSVTSDPTLRAVFAEDEVSVSGDVATRRLAQLLSLCFQHSAAVPTQFRLTILPPTVLDARRFL